MFVEMNLVILLSARYNSKESSGTYSVSAFMHVLYESMPGGIFALHITTPLFLFIG